jgi:hypothetical protein
MTADHEIELVIIEWNLTIVTDFIDLNAQWFQSLACNGEIRGVSFGGTSRCREWLQAREEFSTACSHIELGLCLVQLWK